MADNIVNLKLFCETKFASCLDCVHYIFETGQAYKMVFLCYTCIFIHRLYPYIPPERGDNLFLVMQENVNFIS